MHLLHTFHIPAYPPCCRPLLLFPSVLAYLCHFLSFTLQNMSFSLPFTCLPSSLSACLRTLLHALLPLGPWEAGDRACGGTSHAVCLLVLFLFIPYFTLCLLLCTPARPTRACGFTSVLVTGSASFLFFCLPSTPFSSLPALPLHDRLAPRAPANKRRGLVNHWHERVFAFGVERGRQSMFQYPRWTSGRRKGANILRRPAKPLNYPFIAGRFASPRRCRCIASDRCLRRSFRFAFFGCCPAVGPRCSGGGRTPPLRLAIFANGARASRAPRAKRQLRRRRRCRHAVNKRFQHRPLQQIALLLCCSSRRAACSSGKRA